MLRHRVQRPVDDPNYGATVLSVMHLLEGNCQKVALIAALASDVELLLLDEPTAGLDPLMEAVFQGYILEVKAAGRTVLLSSHVLAQVDVLADRWAITA